MSDVNKQVTDLSTQLAETKLTLSDKENKLVEMNTKLQAAEKKATDAEAKVAELTLALKESTSKTEEIDKELKTLQAWKETEEQRRFDERLTEAFDTYKDARKLTDADKEMMSVFLKANPGKFEERFPKVPADKKHLMRDLSKEPVKKNNGKELPPTTVPSDEEPVPTTINLADAALALSRQKKIPLDQAQRIVFAQAAKAKKTA